MFVPMNNACTHLIYLRQSSRVYANIFPGENGTAYIGPFYWTQIKNGDSREV